MRKAKITMSKSINHLDGMGYNVEIIDTIKGTFNSKEGLMKYLENLKEVGSLAPSSTIYLEQRDSMDDNTLYDIVVVTHKKDNPSYNYDDILKVIEEEL